MHLTEESGAFKSFNRSLTSMIYIDKMTPKYKINDLKSHSKNSILKK